MRVDVGRLVEVLRVATEFSWTGDRGDLDRFCSSVGWTISASSEFGASLLTDLDINNPRGSCFVRNGRICEIKFSATDILSKDALGDVRSIGNCFMAVVERLFEEIGEADYGTAKEGGRSFFRWNMDGIVVFVEAGSRSVYVRLVEPEYQNNQDYIDRELIPRRDVL